MTMETVTRCVIEKRHFGPFMRHEDCFSCRECGGDVGWGPYYKRWMEKNGHKPPEGAWE